MGRARIRVEPIESGKADRYLTKDLGVLSKKRLKMLKLASFSLALSIILNVYLFYR